MKKTGSLVAMGAALLMSTAAIAQSVQPDATLPVPNPGTGRPAVTPAPEAATTPNTPAPRTAALPVTQPAMATGQFIAEQGADQTLATDLMGQKVLDRTGQQIATISDLILDQQSRIAGVVLATGGFLGIGEHNVGVELNQLTPNPNADGYVVDLSREAIEGAPAFKTLAAATAARDAEMMRQPQGANPALAVPAPATAQ